MPRSASRFYIIYLTVTRLIEIKISTLRKYTYI